MAVDSPPPVARCNALERHFVQHCVELTDVLLANGAFEHEVALQVLRRARAVL